jgi:hypothetical protein
VTKHLLNLKNHKSFRLFIYFFIIIFLILIYALIFKTHYLIISPSPQDTNARIANDFYAYYTAGVISKENASSLYNYEKQLNLQKELFNIDKNTFLQFNYPPIASYFFIPFTYLDTETANITWLTLNFIIFSFFIIWIFIYYKDYDWWIRVITIIFIIFFYPLIENFAHGQISLILTLLILFSWFLYKNNKDFFSGILLSFLFIKIQYIILPVIALFFNRNKKILFGFLLGLLSLMFISFLPLKLDGLKNYAIYLFEFGNVTDQFVRNLSFQHNIYSMTFSYLNLGYLVPVFIYIFFASIISLLTLYVWFIKSEKSNYAENMRWAVLIISFLLISPHTNIQDYSFLIAVFIILVPRKNQNFKKIPKNIRFFIISIFPSVLIFSVIKTGLTTFFIIYLILFNFILINEIIKELKPHNKILKRSNLTNYMKF